MALTDEAITGIKRMILSGQVGPGEKLPREKELASRLGLSRSSLREAVRGLAEEGAIDRTRISHRSIYEAISHRDAELARAAATMHIAEVESWFRRQPEIGLLPERVGGGVP